jgi:hypothetical protein
MLFGNRRPRQSVARRRSLNLDRPRGEQLEDRTLLSIDLGGTSPPAYPQIANAPYGIAFAGANQLPATSGAPTVIADGGAGWSVSDLGDVNGDNYDDFLIGGPTVSSVTGATGATLGSGGGSAAYLVFGSRSVNTTSITDWIGTNSSSSLQYTAVNRVSDLGQLGLTNQTNPIGPSTPNLTFPFSGVAFTTTVSSNLGASASTVKIGSTYGLLLGAPGADDVNGANPGTGRAYLITGNLYNFLGQTINLDTPTAYSGITIYTFVNTAAGGNMGYSVAGGTNIFGDGQSDIILGAPNATFGTVSGSGVVYAFSTSLLSGTTSTFNVATQVGQSGSNSAIFTGASSGSQAGWSVADGGDVNGVSGVDDLLIGAPSQNGGGAAYLIYGGNTLAGLAQTVTVNGTNVRYINLANVGAATGTTGAVPGATILGPSASKTGWSVASGGDFNADGFGDILVGSPQYSSSSTSTNTGLVSLLYGAGSTASSYLSGTINLLSAPSGISPLYMPGAAAGALAGYAVSLVGVINSGQPTGILIGSPGFNSSSGTAYLIPGRAGGLSGTQSLLGAESAPLSGVQFLLSTPSAPSNSPAFFGASVSGRIQTTTVTADSDSKEDFIIGAPGYDVLPSGGRTLAGGAMVIQGGLITVPTPASNAITTTITVNTPLVSSSINATTPANLQIYVYGTTTSNGTFEPVRDINAATVVVNGVAFPNATLLPDPNTADWINGIQDAIITITPRSSLGLTAGVRTITISGQTNTTSPLAGETWTGSASVTVTGSSSGGGSSTSLFAAAAGGPVLETTFNSPFGATQFVPTISQLSAYNYAPIPLSVAINQYLPNSGFNERIYAFNHNGKHLKNYLTVRGPAATGIYKGKAPRMFIDNTILDRSRFHEGKSYTWTHKAPKIGSIYKGVVPVQETTQHVADVPGVKAAGDRQIGHTPTSGPTFRSGRQASGE